MGKRQRDTFIASVHSVMPIDGKGAKPIDGKGKVEYSSAVLKTKEIKWQ